MNTGVIGCDSITPAHADWPLYLALVADYIAAQWPEALEGDGVEDFRARYAAELRGRLAEGGRHLLLWRLGREPLGFVNAYLAPEGGVGNALYVAEFSVLACWRGQGWGRRLVAELQTLASAQGASCIKVEVDKPLEANAFWQRVMTDCDRAGTRNVYRCALGARADAFL